MSKPGKPSTGQLNESAEERRTAADRRAQKICDSLNEAVSEKWKQRKFLIEAEDKLGLVPRDMAPRLNIDLDTYRDWLDDNRKIPIEYRQEIERLLAQ